MVRWIHICAWLLIAFAVPGVIYSLVVLDWISLVVNAVLIVIGVGDLLSLKRVRANDIAGWKRIMVTQFLLGLVIGVSFFYAGRYMVKPEHWELAREWMELVMGDVPDYLWADAVARSQMVLKWGTAIGGVAIFLGQLQVCWKISHLTKPIQPPPIPVETSSEKR